MILSGAKMTRLRNYSLVGEDTAFAIRQGLAEATWYAPAVPKSEMRELLQRRDWPAIRDTILWFTLILASAYVSYRFWQAGSLWAIVSFMIYGVLYASSSDSRWHESLHGTAFRTHWLNDALYEIASFMQMREATVWRWSHIRHHSDTLIVGRDPEIAIPRPPNIPPLILSELFGVKVIPTYFANLALHSRGRMTAEQKTFIPESEYRQVFLRAPIYLAIYVALAGLAIQQRSILPFMFIGLPTLYGSWLMAIYTNTQHAAMAEDVLDHRLNCRTVHMNFINRYLYWNMNYHLEHHMFPLVPYHNLARLHELVKSDTPTPYRSLWSAWLEIIPAVLRQARDPSYFVKRELPVPVQRENVSPKTHIVTAKGKAVQGWIEVCAATFLKPEDIIRFDHGQRTYAIYRTAAGRLHATDGLCTHGNTHLSDGFLKGTIVECPKHNGRFDIMDGSPQRLPACTALKTYQVSERNGKVFLDLNSAGGCGLTQAPPTYHFRVVSNENVATFIKELVLEAAPGTTLPAYRPGEYLQLDIPAYREFSLADLSVPSPFDADWRAHEIFGCRAENNAPVRRNYSIAANPHTDVHLRLNVRIALPPRGVDCLAGAGSAYVHRLKAGDRVSAIGPFGDFHVNPGDSEMVYVGGGAGMAPLRAHLSHLFDTLQTPRRVSFWYGARSRQEIFYQDYFEELARRFLNFRFHIALSDPQPGDAWTGFTGNIPEVLLQHHLREHAKPSDIEYYLCGPPVMVKAARAMLDGIGVPESRIYFDEF